jgi:DNA replication protein DnaC
VQIRHFRVVTPSSQESPVLATVDLVNALEQEKAMNKAGQLAERLLRLDLVILDELGYLPFSPSGGILLFHLLSKLYERTSVVITTNLPSASGPACSAMPR